MEEKIRLYVDSNEKGFIDDCYLADNTKIICEFNHEESEIEYSNCKLFNLQEHDKQKDQRIVELEEQLAKEQKHISRLKNMNKSHDETVGRLTEENNQLKQQLAIKDKMINLIWIDLFHLNNDNNDWTISVAQYQKEAIEKLKEGDTNE